MVDYFSHRKDAIEEETDRLHDVAAYQLREEMESDYCEQFGPQYVLSHPFSITDGAAFERLVIERMRKNAQEAAKPRPRPNQQPAGTFRHFATPEAEAEHLTQVKAAQERGDVPF